MGESRNKPGREMSTGPLGVCVLDFFDVLYLAFAFKYLLLLVGIPGLCEFCKRAARGQGL